MKTFLKAASHNPPGRTQHSSSKGVRAQKLLILFIHWIFDYRNNIYDTQKALGEKKKKEKHHQKNHFQGATFEKDLI